MENFDPENPGASRFVDEDFNRVWVEDRLEGLEVTAELRRARRLLHDAKQARDAAKDQAAAMERHLQSLQDTKGTPNLTFMDLRDRVCPDKNARLAYHI